MFRSIDFRMIVDWLPSPMHPKRILTLGGHSFIVCYRADVNTIIVIGSTGSYKAIDSVFWEEVCDKINYMREHDPGNMERGRFYTECSDRNFGPSVPDICREYCIENNLN